MINSKDKGRRGEYDARDLIRKIFGVKAERMPMSGAMDGFKGDMMLNTLPEILRDYMPEVKFTAKTQLREWVKQCQQESNSKTGWSLWYRCPAEWGIPENFIIMMPGIELLGLLKELEDLRKANETKLEQQKEVS